MQGPTFEAMLAHARRRAEALAAGRHGLERRAAAAPAPRSMARALAGECVAVVAEVKRRSPSAGVIRADADPVALARAYASGGAAAISVLTDEAFFGGSLGDLTAVAHAVALPVLRKDFIVDALQVVEARAAGASAVLLIARALAADRLASLAAQARDVGLETLIETHTAQEIDHALHAGATMVGVNSRDLDTFRVDLDLAERLLALVPPGVTVVAESGIAERADVERFAGAGTDAVLVGTSVARASDPAAAVQALTGVVRSAGARVGTTRDA